VEHSDFSRLEEAIPTFLVKNPGAKRVYCNAAEQSMLITLLEEEEQNSRLDLYLPYSFFNDVLKALLPVLAGVGIDKRIDQDALRVSKLISTDLPHLESLSPQDIVALRQNEEAFQMWRVGLSRALDRIRELDTNLFDQTAEGQKILREEVSELSIRTNEKAKKSKFLREVASSGQTFALGAMGAVGAGALALSNPVAGGVSTGITAAAGLLLKFLLRESDQATKALQRHIAILEP
jgi:hypothetical protein